MVASQFKVTPRIWSTAETLSRRVTSATRTRRRTPAKPASLTAPTAGRRSAEPETVHRNDGVEQMSLWNVYVGGFTKEFADEVQKLNKTANIFWKGQYPRFTATPSEGIERLVFDDATGAVRHLGNAARDLVSPQYLAPHPKQPVLYAAEWGRPGRLSAFAIGPDGTLERQSTIDTLGEFAVAVSIHPSGKAAYVAHWGDGSVSAVSLDDAGNPVTAELI